MKLKLSRFLMLLLVLAIVPFAAFAQTADTTDQTNAAGQHYVLNYFANTPLDVSQYQGKALYLNFFTGWCSYCMEEMPDVKKIYEAYDPSQVAVVLVHVWSGEDASDSAKVVKEFGLQDMTMLEDEQMALTNTIGLSGFPTSIFIDKDGYLVGYESGMLTFDSMSQYMDQMGIAKRDGTVAQAATAAPTATPTPKPSAHRNSSDATTGATSSEKRK